MSDAGHISTVDRSQDSSRAFQTAKTHVASVNASVGGQLDTQPNLNAKTDLSGGSHEQRQGTMQQRYTADRRVPRMPGAFSGLVFDVTV